MKTIWLKNDILGLWIASWNWWLYPCQQCISIRRSILLTEPLLALTGHFIFFKTVANCVMMDYISILFSCFWLSVRFQYSYIWLLSPVLFLLSVVRSCSWLPFLLWHYYVLINLQKLFSALRILTIHIFVYCLIVHSFPCAL